MRRAPGFTLLESIIAIAVVLFGLVSIVALSTSSLISSEITEEEFVAANLAREGMELVRQMRDSNWLKFDTTSDPLIEWDMGMHHIETTGNNDYSAVITFLSSYTSDALSFEPDAHGDTCTDATGVFNCTNTWIDTTDSVYFQLGSEATFDSTDPQYSETKYSRMVFLYPICRDVNNSADEQILTVEGMDTCSSYFGADYEQVGIDAIVEVQYSIRGDTKTYTLEEYIYDWKF